MIETEAPKSLGIADSILESIGQADFISRSGQKMRYVNSENEISIYTYDADITKLSIQIDSDGFIHFDVYTKGYKGDPNLKHPDFFAKEFMQKAIAIFRKRGYRIRGFKSTWLNFGNFTSDNTLAYLSNKQAGMPAAEAALNTWSGKLAKSFGFKKVTQVEEDSTTSGELISVDVTFE